jgi:cytochrome c peroxidase
MKQGSPRTSSQASRRRPHGRTAGLVGAALALGALALGGCQDPNAGGAPTRHAKPGHGGHDELAPLPSIPKRPATVSVAALIEKAKQYFAPLPKAFEEPTNPITAEKVALGRMLYFDTRLSKNHDLSCASCHDLEQFGIDVRQTEGVRNATSLGHRGQRGDRNAPTVYNAGLHLAQFWDGRERDLEGQAKGPVLNPVEMAMPDEATVEATLRSIPGYVEAFTAAFPGQEQPVTYDNMAKAIGAFERGLVTPAPFDAFLGGKLTALSGHQLEGLALFIDVGCIQCHTGPGLGGGMFQKLGSVKPWEGLHDPGRMKVTRSKADEFVFKVPSLRNVAQTGPYLHDGSIATLPEMVQKMAAHQLAKGELSKEELSALVDFLGSLTGELPKELIAKPTLPESGPDTRAPDPA